nr:hypothetical protein [Tanacetum cinerariifolium]
MTIDPDMPFDQQRWIAARQTISDRISIDSTNEIGGIGHVGWGQDHMGGRVEAMGTVPSTNEIGGIGHVGWGQDHMGGRVEAMGTVPVCVCTRKLGDYYMAMIRNNLGWKLKDFKSMTFEEIEAKFAVVWKHVEDFIPMGSKKEAKRLKRKWLNLEHEYVKKQKTSEEAPEIEKSNEEIPEEKIKEMMQLVHVKDVYV